MIDDINDDVMVPLARENLADVMHAPEKKGIRSWVIRK